ncbi:hypothetical protein XHV734_4677 [Xanthomonas hortorum pv. vitians]|nr:hypothetical protein XHV734_4677 [Xanthomonas hortorum pv. vitians]
MQRRATKDASAGRSAQLRLAATPERFISAMSDNEVRCGSRSTSRSLVRVHCALFNCSAIQAQRRAYRMAANAGTALP